MGLFGFGTVTFPRYQDNISIKLLIFYGIALNKIDGKISFVYYE